ncbi:hypothetical protein SARC_07985 [Sphaeroforma arctica JP610]|uniref:thioredoxin-disulfide reductase (NADPH) n=1 Tax=Sphaeroforma arctica JP610 TaxID=667725 RepID=A0A0L0FST8_9EUKA|nr:hypothetical protein SARC_07985 [Sphaeroforma arctica JP610]KNC79621.1 hypothetical protein SARC_07985 [Sphaeroforma arctica JP610]|eukprot:XP_014153523.1 hypothetical protein SARC_07985 [Sphaeroforma arctica JP610]
MAPSQYDVDFIVIGGGSGGMAAAKEAAKNGAKVALFDYVKPSTQGTQWGLGGTCVNVGCVPKKIMHYAGLQAINMHDAQALGWQVEADSIKHDWTTLVETVQNHVGSLNWGYKLGLRSNKVNYINATAAFIDAHTVTYTLKGVEKTLSAANLLIAVGGRPVIPESIPGALEHAITSDDIFSLYTSPGRTLCVGASYISLECGGFLKELGYEVDVAMRSIPLRGFDRQCSEKVADLMDKLGVTFHKQYVPSLIKKTSSGDLEVTMTHTVTNEEIVKSYNTVMFATGRRADTDGLNLAAAGLSALPNGKLATDYADVTSVSHIYAIGDCAQERPELTPVAVQAGQYLARRVFGGSSKNMDYKMVATAVFTPFEYGAVGYSEEDALTTFGEDAIEVYLFEFTTLEAGAVHRKKHPSRIADEYDADFGDTCLAKLVCLKNENERVVGFHFIGPNAGEITQGYALALKAGVTKAMFDDTVGIHPTDAESFHALEITRRSGKSWVAEGGCGGGVCG